MQTFQRWCYALVTRALGLENPKNHIMGMFFLKVFDLRCEPEVARKWREALKRRRLAFKWKSILLPLPNKRHRQTTVLQRERERERERERDKHKSQLDCQIEALLSLLKAKKREGKQKKSWAGSQREPKRHRLSFLSLNGTCAPVLLDSYCPTCSQLRHKLTQNVRK